jgi:hypothetical protein
MRTIIAIAIWPVVYILDFFIYLTGAQSFKRSRQISRLYFKRILSRNYIKYKLEENSNLT